MTKWEIRSFRCGYPCWEHTSIILFEKTKMVSKRLFIVLKEDLSLEEKVDFYTFSSLANMSQKCQNNLLYRLANFVFTMFAPDLLLSFCKFEQIHFFWCYSCALRWLHSLWNIFGPAQSFPPWECTGLLHLRVLCWAPYPHVRVWNNYDSNYNNYNSLR